MPAQQTSNLDLPEALVSMRDTVTRLFNDSIAGRDLSEADWWELVDDFCCAQQSWQRHNRRSEQGENVRHVSC